MTNSSNEANPPLANVSSVKDSLESAALPLCPVHQTLEDRGKLEVPIGGLNCLACTLNEREELLEILAPCVEIVRSVVRNIYPDSVSILREVAEFYKTHAGKNRIVTSYPAPIIQTGASASAPTTTVTDKSSVQHQTELELITAERERQFGVSLGAAQPESVSSSSISSTLAEIREQRWLVEFVGTSHDELHAMYCAHIDRLLSIIDSLQARFNEVVVTHEKCYPLVRQAIFGKESAASNMKAAILQRVREWGAFNSSQAEYVGRAGQKDREQQFRICAVAADELATELEAIEVNDLEAK